LEEKACEFEMCKTYFERQDYAFKNAKMQAATNDLVIVGGSTFTVAEVV
jgi:folylpolyglutamate synthase/dihydropteroate synthase